ncbi:hypothetical protein HOC11_00445 [archaeon]|jgi:hypothetical protein|nr:hypothetical protein [archaeon]
MYKMILHILIVLLFVGCSNYNLKPLVEDCCISKIDNKIDKNIYIGHFELVGSKNKNGIYGNLKKIDMEDDDEEIEDIKLSENIDELIRSEIFRRFKGVFTNVNLVESKPEKFIEEKDIFINGKIEGLWFTNIEAKHVTTGWTEVKIKTNTENRYILEIASSFNNNLINDKIKVKYFNKLNYIMDPSAGDVTLGVFAALLSRGSTNGEILIDTESRLDIDNNLIMSMKYDLYSSQSWFNPIFKQNLKATIFDENSKIIDKIDAQSDGNIFKKPPYIYFKQPSTGPHHAISGNINSFFNKFRPFREYKTKSQIKSIPKKNEETNERCGKMTPFERERNALKCRIENILNTEYYDLFRQYTTNSGIIQLMINRHIDNVIAKISD